MSLFGVICSLSQSFVSPHWFDFCIIVLGCCLCCWYHRKGFFSNSRSVECIDTSSVLHCFISWELSVWTVGFGQLTTTCLVLYSFYHFTVKFMKWKFIVLVSWQPPVVYFILFYQFTVKFMDCRSIVLVIWQPPVVYNICFISLQLSLWL